MVNKLFVYGTLKPGEPNEHMLKHLEGSWEPASVQGVLHAEGWGAALGYPGITFDEPAETVEGLVFTSDELDAYWPELDAFEGEGYERVLTRVKLKNGTMDQAYVYMLKKMDSTTENGS